MNLKNLEKHYLVEEFPKEKNKFLLFKKEAETSGRFVHKYLCLVEKKGLEFQVEGLEHTNSMFTLRKQVDKYVKSLPYDSDYFCPRYRAGLTEELIIHDYLNSIGFEAGSSYAFRLGVVHKEHKS